MIANLKLPLVNKSNRSQSDQDFAKSTMDNALNNKFTAEITQAEKFSGVPKEIILAFMMHESECRNIPNAKGSSARGPMQIMPQTIVDAICVTNKWVSDDCKTALVRLLGAKRATGYLKKGMDGDTAIRKYGSVTKDEVLAKPELSILCGSLLLAFLIRRHTNTTTGEIDFVRVIAQYNQGINFKVLGNTPQQELLYCAYKQAAYKYIISMVGVNGIMSVFTA